MLTEIGAKIGSLFTAAERIIMVRERAFSKFSTETQVLNRVVGVTDMLLWSSLRQEFFELTPTQIKKALTGNGRAEKQEVADGLPPYIGAQEYANDDESDAAAVAVAFLLHYGYIDSVLPKETVDEE